MVETLSKGPAAIRKQYKIMEISVNKVKIYLRQKHRAYYWGSNKKSFYYKDKHRKVRKNGVEDLLKECFKKRAIKS